jgi:hypothetical protein
MVRAGTLPRPRSGRGAGPLDRPSHDPTRPAGQQRRQSDRLQRPWQTRRTGPLDRRGFRGMTRAVPRDCGMLRRGESGTTLRHTRGIRRACDLVPRRAHGQLRPAGAINHSPMITSSRSKKHGEPACVSRRWAKRVEGLTPGAYLSTRSVVAAAIVSSPRATGKGALHDDEGSIALVWAPRRAWRSHGRSDSRRPTTRPTGPADGEFKRGGHRSSAAARRTSDEFSRRGRSSGGAQHGHIRRALNKRRLRVCARVAERFDRAGQGNP